MIQGKGLVLREQFTGIRDPGDIRLSGWGLERRIYAEDPHRNFAQTRMPNRSWHVYRVIELATTFIAGLALSTTSPTP